MSYRIENLVMLIMFLLTMAMYLSSWAYYNSAEELFSAKQNEQCQAEIDLSYERGLLHGKHEAFIEYVVEPTEESIN